MAKYQDLKTFLQVNFGELLKSGIEKYVNRSYDGIGFHGINVLSLSSYEVDNLEVKALTCHDDIGPRIKMDVGVAVDIIELGIGTTRYESFRKRRWFTVYLRGNLSNGLTDVEAYDVEEYHSGNFKKDNALDQYLVPYIYADNLEAIAEDFTNFYCVDAIYDGYSLPIETIMREMEIQFYIADLPDSCFGRMYFRETREAVYIWEPITHTYLKKDMDIQPGTMLISRKKYFLGNDGTVLLTIAHELIHWYLHQKYFCLLALLDEDSNTMSCEVEPSHFNENMTMAQKAHWFAEWQANALAIRIAMPSSLVVTAFEEAKAATSPYKYKGDHVEEIVHRMAQLFHVSDFVAKQRMRQLHLDVVDGTYVYVDGKWHEPFSFLDGSLDTHQTFVINQMDYMNLYEKNKGFAALIDSGAFIYLGYVVCINDPKYVAVDLTGPNAELKLTAYAREHAEECCIIFDCQSTSFLKDEYEFYGQAYLSREVKSDYYVEHEYNKDFNLECLQDADDIQKAVDAYNAAMDAEDEVEFDLMKKKCFTFADTLNYHMNRKHITIENLRDRSDLSDTTIKKYRSGGVPQPPIENVMAVCIGLNLPKAYCLHLLKVAGRQINRKSQQGRAYWFLLDYTDGTIEQWNRILDAFKQPHVPDKRNQKTK